MDIDESDEIDDASKDAEETQPDDGHKPIEVRCPWWFHQRNGS